MARNVSRNVRETVVLYSRVVTETARKTDRGTDGMSARTTQPATTLRGRLLLLARGAWVALTAVVIGLPPGFYAAYTGTLPVGTMLVFTAIATGIFWRKSDDRMALFAAFTLAVF